jgi:hypothetical protein
MRVVYLSRCVAFVFLQLSHSLMRSSHRALICFLAARF